MTHFQELISITDIQIEQIIKQIGELGIRDDVHDILSIQEIASGFFKLNEKNILNIDNSTLHKILFNKNNGFVFSAEEDIPNNHNFHINSSVIFNDKLYLPDIEKNNLYKNGDNQVSLLRTGKNNNITDIIIFNNGSNIGTGIGGKKYFLEEIDGNCIPTEILKEVTVFVALLDPSGSILVKNKNTGEPEGNYILKNNDGKTTNNLELKTILEENSYYLEGKITFLNLPKRDAFSLDILKSA